MASLRDEITFWQTKAVNAHHNLLDTIQSAAGKWQAAIAAFLGLYATTGFVLGPDKLATLPVHGGVEIGTVIAFGLAGIVGVSALVLANLATQGIPEIMSGTPVTGPLMYQLVLKRATSARWQMTWSIRLAGIAGVLILAISGFLLGAAYGPRAVPATYWSTPATRTAACSFIPATRSASSCRTARSCRPPAALSPR